MLYIVTGAVEAYAPALALIFSAYLIIHIVLNAFWGEI